jgi:hypothetical protein
MTRNSLTSVHWHSIEPEVLMWTAGLFSASVLWLLVLHNQLNLLFALVFTASILLVALRSKPAAVLLTLAYLILLGEIRRIVSWIGAPPETDLLLLVGPVFAALLATPLLLRTRLRDPLSKAMLLLLLIMIVEIANPAQGGLSVGLAGAIFYIAPVCWFWIGRQYGSPQLIEQLLFRVICPLAVLAAILGLMQTVVGFLPWEQAWIDAVKGKYTALYIGGTIRAFGFSTSSTEYTAVMAIAFAVIVASLFGSRKKWIAALPLLFAAVLLSGGRGYLLKIILAGCCAWSLRRGGAFSAFTLIRLIVFSLIGLTAVGLIASRFAPSDTPSAQNQSAIGNSLSHQAGGFAHPFDSKYSTAGVHTQLLGSAIATAITTPLGIGLGATTAAAARYGGGPDGSSPATGSSEVDFTDMLLSLGVLGGATYVFIVGMSLVLATRYLRLVPAAVSLPMFCVLICTLFSWMIGGQYGISSVMFFLIGGLAWMENPTRSGELPRQATRVLELAGASR